MNHVRRKVGPLTFDVPALLVGLQILAKGWEKLDAPAPHPFLASLLLLLGGVVAVAAFLTLWLEKRTESTHGFVHLAEGVAISLSAIVLLENGKARIPLVMLLAGVCYIVVGLVELQPADRRARLAGPLRRSLAGAFVVAGLVLAGFTAYQDGDAWAFATAGILVVVGLTLLVLGPRFRVGIAHAGPKPGTDTRT